MTARLAFSAILIPSRLSKVIMMAAVGDYDLIVIGAESGGRFYRWFVGELVPPLFRWCDRSVLITNVVEGAS